MSRDDESGGEWAEEIQGAPPAQSRSEMRERRLAETVTVNRYLFQQIQQLEHMLLSAPDLESLLEILLVSLPRHFSFPVSELWLYDPEELLKGLIVNRHRYGRNLRLTATLSGSKINSQIAENTYSPIRAGLLRRTCMVLPLSASSRRFSGLACFVV